MLIYDFVNPLEVIQYIGRFGIICEIETDYFPETEIDNGCYII